VRRRRSKRNSGNGSTQPGGIGRTSGWHCWHLSHRVVWVWVVRERWSACSAGVNLLIVTNIILFISACMCVICYAGAPVSFMASFAGEQVRL
jgi:hypothetical protein